MPARSTSGYAILSRYKKTKMKTSILYSLGGLLLLVLPCAAAPFQFEETGSLNTARFWHTTTLLSNGKVLVAGGYNPQGYLASAELHDPATGIWTRTGRLDFGQSSRLAQGGGFLEIGAWRFSGIWTLQFRT